MTPDTLIDQLVRDAAPVHRHWFERRLGVGLLVGIVVALILVVTLLGTRPDLPAAVAGSTFWLKAAYTASLGMLGLGLAMQVARPERRRLRGIGLVALPLGAAALFSFLEFMHVAGPAQIDLLLGPRWICLPLILMLSVPLFAALTWVLRKMAPTNLRAAGAAIGLTAGGFAATAYCLYCQQVSPTYVLSRYTVAIMLATAIGALLGPRILRW
jgi:hypothetical protein